jgi:DNA invertase Pin-like site-specific DNA recombinase
MSDRAKITEAHRRRRAVVYVRQSTPAQLERNHESRARQYALRDRAVELGWPAGAVVVVDEDLGRSGATTDGRLGFKELVAEVGLGQVGLVLALEVSRLARSSADWHQLLDLCALTGTLIADTDGIYSPQDFNDRLLLGLKGTMSEAELHLIRSRLVSPGSSPGLGHFRCVDSAWTLALLVSGGMAGELVLPVHETVVVSSV